MKKSQNTNGMLADVHESKSKNKLKIKMRAQNGAKPSGYKMFLIFWQRSICKEDTQCKRCKGDP